MATTAIAIGHTHPADFPPTRRAGVRWASLNLPLTISSLRSHSLPGQTEQTPARKGLSDRKPGALCFFLPRFNLKLRRGVGMREFAYPSPVASPLGDHTLIFESARDIASDQISEACAALLVQDVIVLVQ